jgi:hypothetical protein
VVSQFNPIQAFYRSATEDFLHRYVADRFHEGHQLNSDFHHSSSFHVHSTDYRAVNALSSSLRKAFASPQERNSYTTSITLSKSAINNPPPAVQDMFLPTRHNGKQPTAIFTNNLHCQPSKSARSVSRGAGQDVSYPQNGSIKEIRARSE